MKYRDQFTPVFETLDENVLKQKLPELHKIGAEMAPAGYIFSQVTTFDGENVELHYSDPKNDLKTFLGKYEIGTGKKSGEILYWTDK